MYRFIKYIFVVFYLIVNFRLAAQNEIKFDRISIEKGLSQSSVYCIFQDHLGYMWFGTEDGLNKYDGYNFTVYKPVEGDSSSISHNVVYSIFEDTKKNLWIGTFDGLNKYDFNTNSFTHYKHDLYDKNTISGNYILSIYEDKSGELWIGTNGSGLNRYNPDNDTFTRFQNKAGDKNSLSHNTVKTIFEDQAGELWIGTDGGGLNRFDRDNERFHRYQHKPGDSLSISNNYIKVVYQDLGGTLWVGTDDGLNEFNRRSNDFTRRQIDSDSINLNGNAISAICEDEAGGLWVGTRGNGLANLDRSTGKFKQIKHMAYDSKSLSHNIIWSIYKDRAGILWVGTLNGISKFDSEKVKFIHYQYMPYNKSIISNKYVMAIFEDFDGYVWIGTLGGGVDKINRISKTSKNFQHQADDENSLSHNYVYAIQQDSQGFMWFGTNNGLDKFNPYTNKFTHYKADPNDSLSLSNKLVRFIFEDSQERLWVGTDNGLNLFDRQNNQFKQFVTGPFSNHGINNDIITCIFEDTKKQIWIGTWGGGLNKFIEKNERFVHYEHNPNKPESISNNVIYSICGDHLGNLWIGTYGGGLNKFVPEKNKFEHFKEKEGLPNNVIYSILEDEKSNLWMSTNKGLVKFTPTTKHVKTYDVQDGLQSAEFNMGAYFKSKHGEMFFGGINGFNSFFPANVKDNPHIPQVIISKFKIFNTDVLPDKKIDYLKNILRKDISETRSIKLNYDNYVLSFEFTGLHFSAPSKNNYSYMLEGFDKTWIQSGSRRFVTYTNLPPGNFIFRVKASNSDGVWNEKGTFLKISIDQPYWKSWWFVILILLIISVLAYFIYQHLIKLRTGKFLEQKNNELRAIIENLEKSESNLKNLNTKLQIANEKLEVSEDNLTKLNATKDKFFSIISNDLKLPFEPLLESSQELAENFQSMQNEERQQIANKIYRTATHLYRLLEDLLQWSMLKTEQINYQPKKVKLGSVTAKIITEFQDEIKEKEVQIISTINEGITAFADSGMIKTVISNLLENAIKFSKPKGHIEIGIKEVGSLIEFSIKDQGIGIQPDVLKNLFQIGKNSAQNGHKHGTGLGLIVCKEYVERNGGEIWATSQVGAGSTFSFTLKNVWHFSFSEE